MTKEKLYRRCVHEAGCFLVAFKLNPKLPLSLHFEDCSTCNLDRVYCLATINCEDASPEFSLAVHAGGLAALSLVFEHDFTALMHDPSSWALMKGNLEDARHHLLQARLLPSPGDPVFGIFWRAAFEADVDLLENSVEELQSIAGYMLANAGREIFKEELMEKLALHGESLRAAVPRSLCGAGVGNTDRESFTV